MRAAARRRDVLIRAYEKALDDGQRQHKFMLPTLSSLQVCITICMNLFYFRTLSPLQRQLFANERPQATEKPWRP